MLTQSEKFEIKSTPVVAPYFVCRYEEDFSVRSISTKAPVADCTQINGILFPIPTQIEQRI